MGKRSVGMVALLLVAGTALAAEDTVQRAQRCASVADSLERLVCYDQLFAPGQAGTGNGPGAAAPPAAASRPAPAATPARAAASPTVAPAAAPVSSPAPATAPAAPAPAAPANASADFGSEQLRRSASRDDEEPRTLTASVTALRETRRNVFRITLDNDQVWQQMDMDSLFHLEVGDTVEINRGRLGGYRMARTSRGGSGWVRVNRLK